MSDQNDKSRQEALAMIRTIISEEMDVDEAEIRPQSSLREDLEMNEINLAQVIAGCEIEFDAEFEEEDIKDIRTVDDLAAYVTGYDKSESDEDSEGEDWFKEEE